MEGEDDIVIGGGQAVPPAAIPSPVTEEDVADATDGSIAGKLRAVTTRLREQGTKDFDIPGTPLVLRARTFQDADAFRKGVKTPVFIIRSTEAMFLKDEDTGELLPIPKWGKELAAALGMEVDRAAELVERVLDNPVRLEVFGAELVAWMAKGNQDDEQALGE